ncbi:MAG: hypothetical protein PVJ01_04500 [Pseudomonadota bacterium]|jgi:hypothetical protein
MKLLSPRLRHYIKVSPFITAILLCEDAVTLPLAALLVMGTGLLFLPVKCPRCGKRVDYNPVRVFLDQWAYSICVPKKCSRCRHQLSSWADSWII